MHRPTPGDPLPGSPRLVVALIGGLALVACAARAPVPDDRPERLARAAALVAEGCYDCLLDARRLYEGLSGDGPAGAGMPLRLFELDLLLALREKELALDASAALDRARAAAPGLPDGVDAMRLVQRVHDVRADRDGTPYADQPPVDPRPPGDGPEDLSWLASRELSPLAREYLAVSLACDAPRPDRPRLPEISTSEAPLLRYRRAICLQPFDREVLEQVRAEVPRFAEAAVFEARAAFAALSGTDGSEMAMLLDVAYARFPRSPVVLLYLGLRSQTIGDCRDAVRYFGETLAIRARHERARLGRAICRTYLDEPEGAMADATVLIDAHAYNQADAYYWRAFNRHRLKDLDPARQDVEQAKRAGTAPARVFTLAGIIEHDQGELEIAEADLARAARDPAECLARWYYGVVGYRRERFAEAAGRFVDAERCYRRSAESSRREREVMRRRVDLDPAFRERQLAGFDAAIREDTALAVGAALDAATAFAVIDDDASARAALDRAVSDPRADRIDLVRRLLESGDGSDPGGHEPEHEP